MGSQMSVLRRFAWGGRPRLRRVLDPLSAERGPASRRTEEVRRHGRAEVRPSTLKRAPRVEWFHHEP